MDRCVGKWRKAFQGQHPVHYPQRPLLTCVSLPCPPSPNHVLVQGSYNAFWLSAYWWSCSPEPSVHQHRQEQLRKFSIPGFEAVGAFVSLTCLEVKARLRRVTVLSKNSGPPHVLPRLPTHSTRERGRNALTHLFIHPQHALSNWEPTASRVVLSSVQDIRINKK